MNPLLSLFFVIFVDMLGVSIIIPVMAPLFLSSNVFNVSQPTIVLGLLFASYPVFQFFGAPILGALADRVGRKKILVVSLLGTFVGHILSAIAIVSGSLWLLFASRIIDGFTGGNISVAQASIADVSTPQTRARNFGLIGMAFGFGFTVGPFIGGVLSDPSIHALFSFATPFVAAAILSLCSILLVVFSLNETLKTASNVNVSVLTGVRNIARAFKMANLRVLLCISFLLTFGFTFYTQFVQVFLVQKFSFTQSDIGVVFGLVGLYIAFTQGVVTRALSKFQKPSRILRWSIVCLSVAFFMLLVPSDRFYLHFIFPFIAIFFGVTHPNMMAIISSLAGKESQGEIFGITQSMASLAMAIPPVIAGFLAVLSVNLPIIVAGVITFIAWLLFLLFFRKRRELFHEV